MPKVLSKSRGKRMSAPDPTLRTPQIFPRIDLPSPIPKIPTTNFLTVVEEDGTEWCESLDVPRYEAKEDDEVLKAQIEHDIEQEKQLAIAQQEMLKQYRAKLFKNVLNGWPVGKK